MTGDTSGRSLLVQGDVDNAGDVVVFLPPAGSVTSPYLAIGGLLAESVPAVHCEVPGRGRLADQPSPGSVHDAADRWAADLTETVPGRRLHLFGHSLGALYAYELALRFEARAGCEVASLSVSGAREPGSAPRALLATAFAALRTSGEQDGSGGQQDGDGGRQDGDGGRQDGDGGRQDGDGEQWMYHDLRMRSEYRTARQVVRAPLALLCGTSDPFARPAEMERWKRFTSGPYLGMFTFRGGHDYYLSGRRETADVIARVVDHGRRPEMRPGRGVNRRPGPPPPQQTSLVPYRASRNEWSQDMPNDQQSAPSIEQLVDVIANSSVGIAVTDRAGAVVLHNRAQSVLMGGDADHLGGRVLIDGQDGLRTLIQRLETAKRVENVQVTYRSADAGHERSARVNAVLTGSGDGTRIHWVSRPELGERLPVSNDSTEDVTSDAASWIRAVNESPLPALAPTKESEDAMREFYEVAPVAIHLIGVNGQVMHANPADVALVEYTPSPSEYVGQHIRTIYEDKGLLDDFLGRWDEDSPIINFRANFLSRDGAPKPVLIFSTAQAEGGSVTNTRCFVFNDPEPGRARDTISAFGWPA